MMQGDFAQKYVLRSENRFCGAVASDQQVFPIIIAQEEPGRKDLEDENLMKVVHVFFSGADTHNLLQKPLEEA